MQLLFLHARQPHFHFYQAEYKYQQHIFATFTVSVSNAINQSINQSIISLTKITRNTQSKPINDQLRQRVPKLCIVGYSLTRPIDGSSLVSSFFSFSSWYLQALLKRACQQNSNDATFYWNFQKYSVKISYATIGRVYLGFPKWCIVGYSLTWAIFIVFSHQQSQQSGPGWKHLLYQMCIHSELTTERYWTIITSSLYTTLTGYY